MFENCTSDTPGRITLQALVIKYRLITSTAVAVPESDVARVNSIVAANSFSSRVATNTTASKAASAAASYASADITSPDPLTSDLKTLARGRGAF